MVNCIFCEFPEERLVYNGTYVKALFSLWPVTDYHFLTIPARHVADEKDLTEQEVVELFKTRTRISNAITRLTGLRDYNLLLNQGNIAGRTIDHIHYHTGFRREGDLKDSPLAKLLERNMSQDDLKSLKDTISLAYEMVTDPVGGIRNVIPGMGNYKKYSDLIPKREEDVLKWTKQIKDYLGENNG